MSRCFHSYELLPTFAGELGDEKRRGPAGPFLMMITEEQIAQLVNDRIEGSDMFIVSVRVLPSNRIRVFIDSLSGLPVQECVNISRHIESSLDREEEDFELEVSSPGLTEPFAHPLQYRKNIGRTVKLTLSDGSSLKGELSDADDNGVVIVLEEKKKSKKKKQDVEVQGPKHVPFTEIKEAKTVITFK